MGENNYEEIIEIIKNGIILERPITIQEKMIELSKIHDVEAIKILYLIIRLQQTISIENKLYLPTNLDYQSKKDGSTISINLANNTVKAAYRLLDAIIQSFYIDPTIRDERKSTVYGYIIAHLVQIYKADNNFHSRHDLEKLELGISKKICSLYRIDKKQICYTDKTGREFDYKTLIKEYKHSSNILSDEGDKKLIYQELHHLLKENYDIYQTFKIETNEQMTPVREISIYNSDPRFTKIKRYNQDTLTFLKKHF